jgi:hypothetical protein
VRQAGLSQNTERQARGFPPPFAEYSFAEYWLDGAYDEMFAGNGEVRPAYLGLYQRLFGMAGDELRRRQEAADLAF